MKGGKGLDLAGFEVNMCNIRNLPRKLGFGRFGILALLSAHGLQDRRHGWKASK